MIPRSLQLVADALSRLPGVGPRQAMRGAFYLLRNREVRTTLAHALVAVEENIVSCSRCRRNVEHSDLARETPFCRLCADASRDASLLCVVEEDVDLTQLEESGAFRGRYFVLGGRVTSRGGQWLEGERMHALVALVQRERETLKEILLGLNPSVEGDFGAFVLEKALKPLGVKLSRLGRGLPLGGEIEYADQETIKGAIEHRA